MNGIGTFFQVIVLIALVAMAGGIAGLVGRRLGFSTASTRLLMSCGWAMVGIALASGFLFDRMGRWEWSIQSILGGASQVAMLVLMFYAGLHAKQRQEEAGIRIPVETAILAPLLEPAQPLWLEMPLVEKPGSLSAGLR